LPLTIFLIGAKITFKANHDFRYIATALTLRMLLLPLMLWLVLQALEMHGLPYQVALMETAMPPALSTSILALKYNLDEELTVSCIGAGTVLCILIFAGFTALR
jgi:predicted permease